MPDKKTGPACSRVLQQAKPSWAAAGEQQLRPLERRDRIRRSDYQTMALVNVDTSVKFRMSAVCETAPFLHLARTSEANASTIQKQIVDRPGRKRGRAAGPPLRRLAVRAVRDPAAITPGRSSIPAVPLRLREQQGRDEGQCARQCEGRNMLHHDFAP